MAAAGGSGRRWPLRPASTFALLVAVIGALAAAWSASALVQDQESRLLNERASEVELVLRSSIDQIPLSLSAQGGILRATGESVTAYEQAAQEAVTQGKPSDLTFAWLRPVPGHDAYRVLAAAGSGLHRDEVISDVRVATFDDAMHTDKMIATPVFGADRRLGFVMGGTAAPAGTVLYRETAIGPLRPPRAASTAPFAELDVVIYGTPKQDVKQALVSTTPDLPLTGEVRNLTLSAGATKWLLSVKAREPLVGGVAANAWWVTLLFGLLGAALIATVVEITARRRDDALALYASEHQVAETLQRSLLPRLPTIAGLELAARYLAGGRGQEVGGDWFDAFPIGPDRVGIAVGDVIGHDLAAASAMAQIRAALRAYAVDGDPPATVMNRLDRLVDDLGLTQLVTVVYGVLGPPAQDGSRTLTYSNAGHLPPLLRGPTGDVRSLVEGESVVIGAPITIEHEQVQVKLESGSTLLLFTDGLVEDPARPIDDTLDELAAKLAGEHPEDGLEEMCERVLASSLERTLRDDIALLAIRLTPLDPPVIPDARNKATAKR